MSKTESTKTPVNKGQYEFEPQERIDRFHKLMSYGWENEYKEYRRLWNELPAKSVVRDYPLLVDLELLSRCNLKCPMCPTVTDEYHQKRINPFKMGVMSTDLAKKIIDQVAGKIYSLRLSWIGEPTLHPKFIDIIEYAKTKGIPEICFLTNGTKLKLDFFKRMTDAGADWITISIDGMGETYNKIRHPLKFDETLQKIKDIKKYKEDNSLIKPVIKIQGIWPAIKEDPQGYYNTFSPYVDLIAFNPLIDYLHNDNEIVYEDNFYCPQHYQRLVIGANGKVAMCSSDDFIDEPVGDANVQSVYEIWHGEKLNKMRTQHKKLDGFKKISPCARCFYPRKMELGEVVSVNDRRVEVMQYINRAQVIGT